MRNFLASGGIGSTATDGYATAEAAVAAFTASGTRVAVIASSDAVYGVEAEATARALKAAGATHIAMAGRAGDREGDRETAYRAAGVNRFIYAGQDAITTLTELQATVSA